MSVKAIDNQNATKANATRDNAYIIHTNKYIEQDSSKPITTNIREKGTDKCENTLIQAVAIEFSRRREREPSASRTFVRLFVLDYKSVRQSRRRVVVIQSDLCEDALCGKRAVVV